MKVKSHLDFALFDYESGTSSIYQLGDVVRKEATPQYMLEEGEVGEPEIGVIIQVHNEFEYRTDMFGNCHNEELKLATLEDIETIRPALLEHIVKEEA